MTFKLLVIDLDGTLIGKEGLIREDDIEAIYRAYKTGIIVVLSTGRMPQACGIFLSRLPPGGLHIFYDGALVSEFPVNRIIFKQGLKKEVVGEMISKALREKLYLELYTTEGYFIEDESKVTMIHTKLLGIRPETRNLTELLNEQEDIIKAGSILLPGDNRDIFNAFEKYFKGKLRFTHASSSVFPDTLFVNIVDSTVSKGYALVTLADHLNISLNEVVAIGDGENDIPLLTVAGLGIAMDNASQKVKEAATALTLSQEEGGVAFALKKFLGV